MASQPSIRFFPPVAQIGPFRPFFGPQGPKWNIHFLHLTQKERRAGRPECTQVTLFPYNCWVSAAKTRFGPVSGVPGPKRVLGNGRNRPKATGRNYAAGPFMQESGKLQWVERAKFRWLRARLSRFFTWVAPKRTESGLLATIFLRGNSWVATIQQHLL